MWEKRQMKESMTSSVPVGKMKRKDKKKKKRERAKNRSAFSHRKETFPNYIYFYVCSEVVS